MTVIWFSRLYGSCKAKDSVGVIQEVNILYLKSLVTLS